MLTALSADDLRFAVLSDDVKSISTAPGIGKKTAQKLILELKDKLSLEEAFEKRLENSGQAPHQRRLGRKGGGCTGSDCPGVFQHRRLKSGETGTGDGGYDYRRDPEGCAEKYGIFVEVV